MTLQLSVTPLLPQPGCHAMSPEVSFNRVTTQEMPETTERRAREISHPVSERQRIGIFATRSNSRTDHRAIKMESRNQIPVKIIVILSPGPRKPVPVLAAPNTRPFNGNAGRIFSVEEKKWMHDVVSPRPNLRPRAYTKVVAPIERAHVVHELGTSGAKLFETYIIQLASSV